MSDPILRFRSEHMNTWFEVRIVQADETYARQAAQAAFAVATRLEALLSRFREDSEVSQIRHQAPGDPLRLSEETFQLLQLAEDMHVTTGGAFDPGLGFQIEGDEEEGTRGRLLLDPGMRSVTVVGGPVALDLGAIGKGYALDLMAEALREWDVSRALLIAGESSILALEPPSDAVAGWEIALTAHHSIPLCHRSIGSSGTSVKGAHILDPRTGRPPVEAPFRTWALADRAAVSDALSTAWMLLEPEEIALVCQKNPGTTAVLQSREDLDGALVWIPTNS